MYDQVLADAAAYAGVSCALTRRQHFSAWNEGMTVIVKVWRHIVNLTPSIDAYLLEAQSCQTHPDSIGNDGAMHGLFEDGRPNKNKKNNKIIVAILDQFLIQTRKPCYRKDDRAMRPIYGYMRWKFSRVPE